MLLERIRVFCLATRNHHNAAAASISIRTGTLLGCRARGQFYRLSIRCLPLISPTKLRRVAHRLFDCLIRIWLRNIASSSSWGNCFVPNSFDNTSTLSCSRLRTANADSVERSLGACFIDDSSLSDSGITFADDYTASEVKRSDQIVLGFARSRFLVSSFKLLRH